MRKMRLTFKKKVKGKAYPLLAHIVAKDNEQKNSIIKDMGAKGYQYIYCTRFLN